MTTVLTARGQTSVPARLRRNARLSPGQCLHWQAVSETEFRVTVETPADAPGPLAVLGWARRGRSGPVRTSDDIMRELREGDAD
ncbi:MAG: sporulation regulator [Lentisphaeria bacterium]|nr:sporulation regulator [Lentisphaeria bacterium]